MEKNIKMDSSKKIKTKTITQVVTFKTSPHDVYEALMDSKKHTQFTGGKASISRKVGGKFTVYDGYAYGKNVELVADKKIVQTWQASDWQKEVVSTVTFYFEKTKTGTKVVFTQKNIPADQEKNIKEGWKDYYWTPMKVMLEK